jgi:hypothetical protein
MKRFLTAALLLVAGLFAACRACPQLLIIPHLTFVLPENEANALTAAPAEVRTCLDSTCWTLSTDTMGNTNDTNAFNAITFAPQTRQLSVSTEVWDGGTGRVLSATENSTVTLTVSCDGGTLFTHDWSKPEFEKTEPLGEGCGVFYQLKSPLAF